MLAPFEKICHTKVRRTQARRTLSGFCVENRYAQFCLSRSAWRGEFSHWRQPWQHLSDVSKSKGYSIDVCFWLM